MRLAVALLSLPLIQGCGSYAAQSDAPPRALVAARTGPISVDRDIEISTDAASSSHAEWFLAANPHDPSNFIATSAALENGQSISALYYSTDRGASWQCVHLPSSWGRAISGPDATVYFDHMGVGYFITEMHGGFWVSRSNDGGRTWDLPAWTLRDEGFDRPVASFGLGPYEDRMFLTAASSSIDPDGKNEAAIATSASDDAGKTFGPEYIFSGFSPISVFPIDTLVDREGHLFVPAGAPGKVVKNRWPGTLWIRASSNGGKSYTPAVRIGSFLWPTGMSSAVYERNQGMPRAAIDLSRGPFGGRIYIVYSTLRGDNFDVDLIHSTTDWQHWSRPVRVNDNRTNAENGDPAIAVNPNGAVAVTWADRRESPGAQCYRFAIAGSTNGGVSFAKNVLIHGPTCPGNPRNWAVAPVSVLSYTLPPSRDILLLTAPARWWDGGDTQGLTSTPDGEFQASWINGESGTMQLWFTEFRVTGRVSGMPQPTRDILPSLANYSTVGIAIDVLHCDLNISQGTLALDLRLRNTWRIPVRLPLELILRRLPQAFKNLRVANADNRKSGAGAAWRFSESGTSLAPDAVTGERTVLLRFDGLLKNPQYPEIPFDVRPAR